MPKPRYKVSNFEKDLLLHNIYMKTGFIIQTKSDCSKIARIVSEKNDFISESTIYRLFLLKNKSYTPYMHTLNVLSKFCEYENWPDLIKKNQATKMDQARTAIVIQCTGSAERLPRLMWVDRRELDLPDDQLAYDSHLHIRATYHSF